MRAGYVQAGLPNILMRVSEDNKSGEIEIYGSLDEWGFQKREFNHAFRQLKDADLITVRIDSEGGNPYDGFYIHDALRNHKAHIITRVDGIAASAAVLIMMAGDERQIVENGWTMIHCCYGTVKGGADDLENYASVMRKINQTYANIVARTTGIDVDTVVEMMEKETWMTGQESFDNKLATKILAPVKIAARASLSSYQNVPEALRLSLGIEDKTMEDKDKGKGKGNDSAAGPSDPTTDMTDKVVEGFFAKLAQSLGMKATTTPTTPTTVIAAKNDGSSNGSDDGGKKSTADTSTVDIAAVINQAVDSKLQTVLSSSMDGIKQALTETLSPVLTAVSEIQTQSAAAAASFRNTNIVNRLERLVNSGRLTPAQFSAQKNLLTSATIADDKLESYLADLEKTPSLLAATNTLPVDPDSGEALDLPIEITPHPASGYVVNDINGAKIVAKAKGEAEKVQGDSQKKYEEFRRQVYSMSGEGTPRTSLSF